MDRSAKIFVAGHNGLVGSALVRVLKGKGYDHLLLRTHAELDLTDQKKVDEFFEFERPDYVFLAAAKVGGILANNNYPAEFIRDNLAIQTNVIHSAWKHGVKRFLFLGSSCIYPRNAPQPMREEFLLSGALEPTNRPYALAKIAGIEMCWAYNRQHKTQFLSVMPTNLYGLGDNYHPEHSHVIPGLIRRFHEAKVANVSKVAIWGTGTPFREFLFGDDMAEACVYLICLPEKIFIPLLGQDRNDGVPPLLNIGSGQELTIGDLAAAIKDVVGYQGEIYFDVSKPDGTVRKLIDSTKIYNLGWAPQVKLSEGLEVAYRDYLARLPGH